MQIACPSCQKQLRVPDTAIGKRVKCPVCATTFQVGEAAVEHIQAYPAPPVAKTSRPVRPPAMDDDEDAERLPRRARRRGDEDEELDESDERLPRRARGRRDDDDDFDDDERTSPRARRRRDDDDFDEDDSDDYKPRRSQALRKAKAAGIWFIIAGILTLTMIALNIGSTLYVNARLGDVGRNAGEKVGRNAGLFGCGAIAVTGAIFQFLASASLRSFQQKGRVTTAIVFGFIFGALFGIGLVINLSLIAQVPAGWMRGLVWVTIIFGGTTSAFNLFAAINGIITLNNRAVRKRFRR
jgi:predicted Zn finger-like uncharacterized protein